MKEYINIKGTKIKGMGEKFGSGTIKGRDRDRYREKGLFTNTTHYTFIDTGL
jgi:hypothetical protein